MPLPIPDVGIYNAIPVETIVATKDIVGPQANDVIDPPSVDENNQLSRFNRFL